jgi:hypothetical protein
MVWTALVIGVAVMIVAPSYGAVARRGASRAFARADRAPAQSSEQSDPLSLG